MDLRLDVREFESPLRWRWLLTEEASGRALADQLVELSASDPDRVAFADLYGHAWRYAVPDRRAASEAQIIARSGAWAGEHLLGKVGAAIAAAAPATVRVVLPERARFLLGWPLELAHVSGAPLAGRPDLTFVYDLTPSGSSASDLPAMADAGQAERALRVLALFSLPSGTSVLALRRERFELTRLIRQIAARQGRRVEFGVVQYGATREKLASVVQSGDGWDVLHLSGHGAKGQFWLEQSDGSPDPVTTADLVNLLAPLQRRVRLAVVSACESGAATVAETLRLLGLDERAEPLEQEVGEQVAAVPALTGIATAVTAELECPVVAMRYPVGDAFAVRFAKDLYERLLGARDDMPGSRGEPLGLAVTRAVRAANTGQDGLAQVTPVLVSADSGAKVASLILDVPRGRPELDPAMVRMERFPPEADRFVGRTQAMTRASAALAPRSGKTGVLLYGMAGSGKTACAIELAYRHQGSFAALAWWQAPVADDEFGAALASLAAALDIQLDRYRFAMSGEIATVASVEAFAARLRRLLDEAGLLLVLDNLESLLTPDGAWRDPRWQPLMAALTGHAGESRVILTSRIAPADLPASVLRLPVHTLDLGESAALARELPNLSALLHAEDDPVRDDEQGVAADRDLVRRVLRVVQGHPKLMEFADAAAADPPALADRLDAAEAAAGGGTLETFFRDGTTALGVEAFMSALSSWTTATLDALPESAALMARFMACLEESDRVRQFIDSAWAGLRRRLALPGDPPGTAPLLDVLATAALIQHVPAAPAESGETPDPSFDTFRMHPGVAQVIAATAGDVRAAADAELAAIWIRIFFAGLDMVGGERSAVVVRAGLAAAPYLLRLGEWDSVGMVIEHAVRRDRSPEVTQAALPALRAIAAASGSFQNIGILARALQYADPAEAEQLMVEALRLAEAAMDYRVASVVAGDLLNLFRDTGRLDDALALVERKSELTRQAGLGPWSQLADEGWRLQVLAEMGQHEQVLDQLPGLTDQMAVLPVKSESEESMQPWNVRESILHAGYVSARGIGRWQQALELNTAILASKQARGAGPHEMAGTQFNRSNALIRLNRLNEASQLLADCQRVFFEQGDVANLGLVLAARASVEFAQGTLPAALNFARTALRYGYARPLPVQIAVYHYNLAGYLAASGINSAAQLAHRLGAALLYRLVGRLPDLASTIEALALGSRELSSTQREVVPDSVEQLVELVEQEEGVHFGMVLAALQPDPAVVAGALAEILRLAGELAAQEPLASD